MLTWLTQRNRRGSVACSAAREPPAAAVAPRLLCELGVCHCGKRLSQFTQAGQRRDCEPVHGVRGVLDAVLRLSFMRGAGMPAVTLKRALWAGCCAAAAVACSRSSEAPGLRVQRMESARPAIVRTGCADASSITLLEHRANLLLTLSPPSLDGHGEVRMRAQTATHAVQLDTEGMRILYAGADGRSIRFRQEGGTTCFAMSPPMAAGDEVALALKWQVDPAAQGIAIASDQAWAGPRASAWLPTRMDLDQLATLSVTLTYPDGLELVMAHDRGGTYPMSYGSELARATQGVMAPSQPALYAYAVGKFRTARYYGQGFMLSAVGPSDADLEHVLELTLPMHQFLSDRLGRLPGYAHYTQVFVHADVVQEAVGVTYFAERLLGELRGELTAAHDWILGHGLVHQWFGVRVLTGSEEDLWLSEGLATFMVGAMKEHRWGRAAYEGELATWRECSRQLHEHGVARPLVPTRLRTDRLDTAAQLRGDGLIYCRGALVLDKLRSELGDQVFWDGMRAYAATQAGQLTRTEDLRNVFSKVSGRDLTPFFSRWVYAVAHDF